MKDPVIVNNLLKEIQKVSIEGDTLTFKFKDNTKLELTDDGQSCCENRYMNTDDCLNNFKDSTLINIRIENGPMEDKDWDIKECQFLIVDTSKGSFTVANYNEHNGYYGGFNIVAKEVE